MTLLLPVLSLLCCARSVQALPVVEQPAPVELLDLGGSSRAGLLVQATLDRGRAMLSARALDRLIYIDMAPTPGAWAPGPGAVGDEGGAGPDGILIGPPGPPQGGRP